MSARPTVEAPGATEERRFPPVAQVAVAAQILVIASLLIFAVDVPMLIAFSVARYQPR